AWTEFVELYEPLVLRLARSRGLQDADARDVTQEVLVKVSTKIDRFCGTGHGSFRRWLATITRHQAIDLLRSREVAGSGRTTMIGRLAEVAADDSDLSDSFDRARRVTLFQQAARQVQQSTSAAVWQVFQLAAIEQRPAEEVAQTCGLSIGAVYVSRCRTQAKIKDAALRLMRMDDGEW
ncbi:MAG: sigma-70 family RNA polymerase sigma factor, partial [Planctomycetota bacterium]